MEHPHGAWIQLPFHCNLYSITKIYSYFSVGPNTGRRAQYYVRHNDGSFKYGHDTGLASFESAHLGAGGQVRGKFGFVAEDDGIYREVSPFV